MERRHKRGVSYAFGPFVCDPDQALLRRGDKTIALTPRVFDLLVCFLEAPGSLIPKDELFNKVWGDTNVQDDSLTQAISSLREELGDRDHRHPAYIMNVPKRGYRFVADVTTVPMTSSAAPASAESDAPATRTRPRTLIAGGLLLSVAAVTLLFLLFRDSATDAQNSAASQPSRVYDFEDGIQGWGEHPPNRVQLAGQGVRTDCARDLPAHSGRCSLVFSPTIRGTQDAYVAVSDDTGEALIEAWVNVKEALCGATGCSTAKIVVWDQAWQSFEGSGVELRPGWKRICLDLRGKGGRAPFREMGLHIFLADGRRASENFIYLDRVTIRTDRAAVCG